jgi:hypothetical protein
MKKIVLTMAVVLSGALIATVANASDDYKSWPGHRHHASKGSKASSRLPLRSKYSKKVMSKEFNIPLKRKIHHGEIQVSKGFGIPLKRKATHGETQDQAGWDIPLKRKGYTSGGAKDNFHIPLRRIKHRSADVDVGKDL